jgi:glycosyltransferase involved in cell wall biosynthesis
MVVVSSAPLIRKGGKYYAYGPYVSEMALWSRYLSQMDFVCPVWDDPRGTLCAEIPFQIGKVYATADFNLKSFASSCRAVLVSPYNFLQLFRGMRAAGHIHLRCPGNLPLMGCIVQVFFPFRCKSAKYAGNWDPNASQPASYRFQKWLLSNTILTRRMQVMAYGNWPGSSRNVRPFFTATYTEADKLPVEPRSFDGSIRMVFIGTLSEGKRPLYALQLVERLRAEGRSATLDFYGNGAERPRLESYISQNDLSGSVRMMGNQPPEIVAQAYRDSHFVILPSRSEGWPKAVAEGMFWGCLPLATRVSCVPYMLGDGSRGLLLRHDLYTDVKSICALLDSPGAYRSKVTEAIAWSRQFTVDLFAREIQKILAPCE